MNSKTLILFRLTSMLFIVISFCIPHILKSQDSFTVEDLRKFAYPFDIEDGIFIGEGAEILTKTVANAHVVMLGNNLRSQLESDLDQAFAMLLNQNDYKTVMMEIGSASAKVVNRIKTESSNAVEGLKSLNNQYSFELGGSGKMPIPDLTHKGPGEFVQYVTEQGWSIGGVGVDTWTSYKMIIDELYNNLPAANQRAYQKEYSASTKLLDNLYSKMKGQSYDDLLGLTSGLKASDVFNQFIETMGTFKVNKDLIKSLNFSIEYWSMFGNRDFFTKNKLSDKRNKRLMKEMLDDNNFDFEKDKLFLKMYRGHLSKGVSPNGFYGVGNTLMELAEYHGHNSLSIGVLGRYTLEDNVLTDIMDSPERVQSKHQPFVSLGQADNWVLIDLRPLNKLFYSGRYIQTMDMLDMMRSYDMIIIPAADRKAEVNK